MKCFSIKNTEQFSEHKHTIECPNINITKKIGLPEHKNVKRCLEKGMYFIPLNYPIDKHWILIIIESLRSNILKVSIEDSQRGTDYAIVKNKIKLWLENLGFTIHGKQIEERHSKLLSYHDFPFQLYKSE